ncbi:hypothetical protein [Pyrobaculum aerophilum]|uniref:Uncharacterized protein n=1 Tax=Pyrobaculum aerophilum TaxID=13773 RepID=A0A371R4B1_9CREN|nr:hypothetical protein [Pyrobaculum aerophilum]RFA94261.1 hypothetical protein CGL51_10565 [Pyrobaculum aerophilum]RFA98614.1 hypothetical protein CGL52_06815 [Pyrobaculum aerophilum]
MEKRSIYSGVQSCYALAEGVYVEGGRMDLAKAAAHLYLHMRDLERGYTYDHECKRIKMTPELFEARSKFLVKLCREQGGSDCDEIERLVDYVLKRFELPQWALELANKKIVKISRLF